MEGNLRFKIDWASLIVGSKFTVFALFYFVFEGNFQVQAPRGLIFGGAYTWRDLFSEFYGIPVQWMCCNQSFFSGGIKYYTVNIIHKNSHKQ